MTRGEGAQTGPVYDRDGIMVWHGDCRAILPLLDAVDHVITDPPYEAEAHTKARRIRVGTAPGKRVRSWDDAKGKFRISDLPFEAINAETRQLAACQIGRLAQRWALVFCQAEGAHIWEEALVLAGHTRRRWCVWVKPDGQPQFSGDRPGMGYETIVATHTPGRSHWNGGGKVGVFTYIKNVTGSQREAFHPTEKPIALMRELVALFTDPGDLILDPFMGSGTTLVAAKQLGRRAIGIELERKWVDVAIKRLEGTTPPLLVVPPEHHEQLRLEGTT